MEIKCNAVVLRASDYKDNDKLLTLFTAERGKLTAVCRGVKKSGAKLKFAAQPFCFAEYILAERGGRFTVTSAFQHDAFYALREDVAKFYAASAVLETCNAVLPEELKSEELFVPCVRALGEIAEGEEGFALLKFLVSALDASGYALRLDGCLNCGKEIEGRVFFSFEQGGFYCGECPAENTVAASAVTYRALRCAREGIAFSEGDGVKRALRLLKEYFSYKTDVKVECLSEYIRLI